MSKAKAVEIAERLLANADKLRYGTVTVSAKLHDGRLVEVAYSTTENTREREAKNE
jgi:hypothetical protein